MRASRETELLEEFPIHVVAKWLGHSPVVAMQHYAQIVGDQQDRAVKWSSRQQAEERAESKAKQKAKHRRASERF